MRPGEALLHRSQPGFIDPIPHEGLLVQRRITSVLAGLITLSMVVFGQVCALSALVDPSSPTPSERSLEASSARGKAHGETCTSEACGGGKSNSEKPCSGASAMCCSTWAPPCNRVEVPPPAGLSVPLSDLALVLAIATELEDRALGVALFQLDRPPGFNSLPLLTSSLSRRGPPARS